MSEDFDDIRFRDLHFFERLATLGSITAAAKDLRLPKATASRWLVQLEDRVGVPLVKRTTRTIALTPAGKEFLTRARDILAAAKSTRQAVQSDTPQGLLRVSVPVPMGRMLAGPVIARFRRRLPEVRLEIKLQNERIDLIHDGFDLAIRGGALTDSDLMTRRLSAAAMWLYASSCFRDERLENIPLITSPGDELLLRRANMLVRGQAAVIVDDRTAVADAMIWGAGAGLLPSFLGEQPRADGLLVRLHDDPIVALPVHAIFHASQRDDLRLIILIEEIENQLKVLL